MSDFHATSDSCAPTILRQSYGRFEARARIGPAIWPHHDLLWIHRGAIRLRIEGTPWQDLEAPAGIWIPPGTRFDGIASNRRVTASITHFVMRVDSEGPRPRIADPALANLVQAMVELSQSYAAAEAPYPMRTRLLASILDALERAPQSISNSNRIDNAWRLAGDRLSVISGIGDVAALIDLSESTFRAQHRKQHKKPRRAVLDRTAFGRRETSSNNHEPAGEGDRRSGRLRPSRKLLSRIPPQCRKDSTRVSPDVGTLRLGC